MSPARSKLARFALLAAALVAVGVLFPFETVRSIVAIVGLLLGVPLLLVSAIDAVCARNARTEPRSKRAIAASLSLRVLVGLLGLCGMLFGAAIVVWILYNLFVERQEEFRDPAALGGFGIAPVMVVVGVHLLRLALGHPEPTPDEGQAVGELDDDGPAGDVDRAA